MNQISEIICINLVFRKNKRKYMIKQCKKLKIRIKFFDAIYVKENPVRGCLLSHLNIIKDAKKRKLKNVMILEDDCEFLRNPKYLKFPKKWDMLYLGGNLENVYEKIHKGWMKMCCWTTHSYIINRSIYDIVINNLEKYDKEIDRFYKDKIHPNYNCYMINPVITKQKYGYSDIEGMNFNYEMRNFSDMVPINKAEYEMKDGKVILKLSDIYDKDLPKVSILTPTYNRKKFFELAIHNFKSFIYPHNKLEWIIVDDGDEDLRDILPSDSRIRYIRIKTSEKLSISFKRNLCVKYSNYDYLIHMDDDDIYFPTSILSRIKTLLKYPKKGCVCCTKIGCYNLSTNSSYVVTNKHDIAEASLGYTRAFFSKRKFDKRVMRGEGRLFIRERRNQVVQIPYEFIMIAVNHNKNLTKEWRSYDMKNNNQFILDNITLNILNKLKVE